MSLLLALDAGGSGMRATLVGHPGGEVVARSRRGLVVERDAPPLGVSYRAEALARAATECIAALLRDRGGDEVAAVAITGQRIACALLDGQLDPVYIGPNLDARGVPHGWRVDQAAGGELYERTGRGLGLLHAPARLLWLRENRPDEAARVRWVCGIGDWLAWRLCGELAMERSGAVDLLAWDARSGRSSRDLWSTLGLDEVALPPIAAAATRLGAVTAAAADVTGLRPGTAVAVCPPDSMAALLGAGAVRPGPVLVLAGSTMPVLAVAERPRVDPQRRTWASPHPIAPLGVAESDAGLTGAGWAWMVERLVGPVAGVAGIDAYAHADRLAGLAPAGSRGALAFTGGASVQHATAQATFLPRFNALFWPTGVLDPETSAAEVMRSCLESVAHAARANLLQAEEARNEGEGALVLAGGMAQSRLFAQMVADICRRTVRLPAALDVTAMGAAACASVVAGLEPDLAAAGDAVFRVGATLTPDASVSGAYAGAHREWRRMYERIASLG